LLVFLLRVIYNSRTKGTSLVIVYSRQFALYAKTRHFVAVLRQSDRIWALNACMAHFGPC